MIVGYGDHVARLKSYAEELGVLKSVKFLGRLSYEELGSLTGQADVGVIPYVPCDFNTTYCSPNKFFEFIASGVPVVANDLPFLRMELERYGCGKTANILESRSFASAIVEVLRNHDLKSNCRKAQSELGWDVEQKKLLDWYTQLI